ncbi:preprotein translocase subunit SecG [Yersinia rochesterensis]|uniref:heme acquisition protein HasA n=1 Tax=Yersinia TaxID=629 RepID=UPI00223F767A|nr:MULTISPECIES: heme acquisition protein HasA [Yersinia]MDA5545958.1 preprotein translocase subunit SecG [Yersinia rochesterensis]UZM74973.1 heme acquisition protein HasA [Yersinia sp. SCPM-O-B-9106 (C-191)]
MAVTITYDKKISHESISLYTRKWANYFGDITLAPSDNSGEDYIFQLGSYNPGNSGSLYAYGRINPQQNNVAITTGYVATTSMVGDDLFNQQVTAGINGSLYFGEEISPLSNIELSKDQLGHEIYYRLKNEELKFDGLDIADDIESSFYMLLHSYIHHDCLSGKDLGVYGLLRGDAEPILKKLKAQGIDVDTPLKDMAIASQFEAANEVINDAPVIDTVGAAANVEVLLAA